MIPCSLLIKALGPILEVKLFGAFELRFWDGSKFARFDPSGEKRILALKDDHIYRMFFTEIASGPSKKVFENFVSRS